MKSFIKFFLLLLLTGYVLNSPAALGATCTTGSGPDDGCTDAHAACTGTPLKCTCTQNYEAEGTACVLSLGKTCTDADTCVANSQCTGTTAKTCACKENYEAEGSKCVVSLGKTCKEGDTCVANAECTGTTDKKCTCKTNYTAKDNKCESNDTSGSSFLKVFVISFLSLLF